MSTITEAEYLRLLDLRDDAEERCARLCTRNAELLAALKETLVWIDDAEAKQAARAVIAWAEEESENYA